MKKKIYLIGIFCLMIIACLAVMIPRIMDKYEAYKLYKKYQYPSEEVFGKELYSEITYRCSDYESEVGNLLIDQAIEVAEYTGIEQDAKKEIGEVYALDYYYLYKRNGAIAQEVTFQFVTCKISENSGHVWILCTKKYDEAGEVIYDGSNIPSLWYIEKQEEEWRVVKVMEGP